MRVLIILIFLRAAEFNFSQQPIINDLVVATPDRDFVWIINNSTGKLIYENWQRNPEYNGFKPSVSLVSDLGPYRKRVKKMTKNSKKSK